ncbi:hypothetical protein A4X13_0g1423 [Tilletia indica]|uniref:Gpi16 subunit, GPI transamidase component n=1 Tax=Tilletia indica TaxID=43049 RepID=A0A177TLY5_9BASI|nr:hypothetical protein A4X13_0g1423 [Tilletia indica]
MRFSSTRSLAAATALGASIWLAAAASSSPQERFDEDLLLRPLPDGGIHAAFYFNIVSGGNGADEEDGYGLNGDEDAHNRDNTTSWLLQTGASESHFRLLPRSLIQIAQAASTREFKLSINAGSWQYSAWGEPTLDIVQSSASSSSSHSAGSSFWGKRGRRAREETEHREQEQEQVKVLGDDAVGNGAELWASFLPPAASVLVGAEGPSARDHARLSWRKLTSALAGLFCASLDTTLSPRVAVQPSEARLFSSISTNQSAKQEDALLLHAFAPSESICTENLTPFLKLLPCRSASAGLAQLLNPHALFSSAYHGLSVHVIRLGSDDGSERWRVQLRVQAVYTAAQARMRGRKTEELALKTLFNRNITQACPLATSSNVFVPRPPGRSDGRGHDDDDDDDAAAVPDEDVLLLDADHSESFEMPSWPQLSILDRVSQASSALDRGALGRRSWRRSQHSSSLSDTALSGLALAYDLAASVPSEAPSLEVYRTHTSAHPTRGTFVLTLTNWHPTEPVRARYYDELPWWMKAWMHTLQVVKVEDVADDTDACTPSERGATADATCSRVGSGPGQGRGMERSSSVESDIVRFMDDFLCPPILAIHYEPSAGRDLSPEANPGSGRPSLLELDLRVPASSRVRIQMEYDLAFLRYTEHPPGPQKGWGVPPGILVVLGADEEKSDYRSSEGKMGRTDQSSRCPVEVPRPRPGQRQISSSSSISLPPLPHPAKLAGRGFRRRVYTEAALIELAVPDFSMIYNLILFTSTEIALFFGSIFNLVVRRFGDVTL